MHTAIARLARACTLAQQRPVDLALSQRARGVQRRILMPESTPADDTLWSDLPPRRNLAGPLRVLLVDDEEDFLELTSMVLQSAGCQVECARAAGEAVARAIRHPPDVILLDILLPGCDGLEILEALRQEPETAEVPVLACTALGDLIRRRARASVPACSSEP